MQILHRRPFVAHSKFLTRKLLVAFLLFVACSLFLKPADHGVLARPLFAGAVPTIETSIPAEVMVGENFTFDVTLGPNASETGYGPFIDVVFPVVGAGPTTPNGFDFVSATFLGATIECFSAEFKDNNGSIEAKHPFALDKDGKKLVVKHATGGHQAVGDKLVSCKLPFGSLVPSQPKSKVTFTAKQLGDPAVSSKLPIYARGGFMFGKDPLDNWCCDYVLDTLTADNFVSSWDKGDVEPVVIKTNKEMLPGQGSEYETPIGPNFTNTYKISIDIANGKKVTGVQVTETLDTRVQFVSVTSVSSGSCGTLPSTTTPGGTLICNLGDVTGGNGTEDASVTFTFQVLDKDGATPTPNNILEPGVGGCNGLIPNTISVQGTFGGTQTVSDIVNSDHEFYACAIASQKSKSIVNDVSPTGASPGDTIEYTLNFQVSDYFSVEDIVLKDVFSDGQLWDASFTPTLTLTEHGSTSSGNFDPGSYTIVRDTSSPHNGTSTGETTVTFNIAAELAARSLDLKVLGGCVPAGGGAYNCTPPNNLGATKGQIKFRTKVQDVYTDFHLLSGQSGDASLDQGDKLKNEVSTEAEVLDNVTLVSTTKITKDAKGVSSVEVALKRGTPSKSIHAFNGNTTVPSPLHVSAGDIITYKIKYELTTSNVEDLYLTDYLPLPVLDVNDPKADGSAANWPAKVTSVCAAGTSPPAGDICFSSNDTYYVYSNVQPTVSINSTNNTLKIDYGDFDKGGSRATVIELLFSIAVKSDPFADGLKLTNQATVHEGSTVIKNTSDSSAIIDFTLDEPVLVGKKGVVATDSSNATLNLPGYTFVKPDPNSPPTGKRWTSPATIDSTCLKSNSINADISGSDGGDLVTFAIVIENGTQAAAGKGGAYDITIKDTLPAQLQIPASGLNLAIYYGDGTNSIGYKKPDGSAATPADLFSADGIRLDDPAAGGGVCQSHLVGPGKNIIIITYDLQIKPTVTPGSEITNSGTITNYSNKEGGEDFTGPGGSGKEGDLDDKAKITISDPAIAKSIGSTSIPITTDGKHRPTIKDLTIGEEVTFEIEVTIPEGNSIGVTITDNLPTTMAGVLSVKSSCVRSFGTAAGTNLTSTAFAPSAAVLCPNAYGVHKNTDGDAYNDQVIFEFGDITNSVDGVDDAKDKIILEVVARVEGEAANQDGNALTNIVKAKTGTNTQTGSVDFDIVVPNLSLTKNDGTDYFSPGGRLVYGLTYENTGSGPALGVALTETVPANTTFDSAHSTTGWVLFGTATPCPDGAAAGTTCEYQIGQVNNGDPAQTVYFAVVVDNTLAGSVTQIENSAKIADELDYSTATVTDTNERVTLGKAIQDTNQAFTSGNKVVIGELVTYRLVLYIPAHSTGSGNSGLMPNLTITDDLDEGLAFMDCVSVTASSADLITDLTGGFRDACAPNTVNHQNGNPAIYPIPQTGTGSTDAANQGRRIVFDLGNVTNNSATQETITIDYRVAVLDHSPIVRDVEMNNQATAQWKSGSTLNQVVAVAPNVIVVEPEFTLDKYADRKYVYGGETITFSFEIRPIPVSVDSFEVILTDPISPKLKYVPGSLMVTEGLPASKIDESDPENLQVTWDTFPSTSYAIVEFRAYLKPGSDGTVGNLGYLDWTSLSRDFLSAPQSPFNELSTERWYDPPANVGLGQGPGKGEGTYASIELIILGYLPMPETGFPQGQLTRLDPNLGVKPQGMVDHFELQIPSLGRSMSMVNIPRTESGWDLTWLEGQAGFLDGTAYPTWSGNTVLTGHAFLADGMPGPFVNLDELGWGDQIIIDNDAATYVYEVRERYFVTPEDISGFKDEDIDWLTLITCYQYDEEQQKFLWRTVVRAVLIDRIAK